MHTRIHSCCCTLANHTHLTRWRSKPVLSLSLLSGPYAPHYIWTHPRSRSCTCHMCVLTCTCSHPKCDSAWLLVPAAAHKQAGAHICVGYGLTRFIAHSAYTTSCGVLSLVLRRLEVGEGSIEVILQHTTAHKHARSLLVAFFSAATWHRVVLVTCM